MLIYCNMSTETMNYHDVVIATAVEFTLAGDDLAAAHVERGGDSLDFEVLELVAELGHAAFVGDDQELFTFMRDGTRLARRAVLDHQNPLEVAEGLVQLHPSVLDALDTSGISSSAPVPHAETTSV